MSGHVYLVGAGCGPMDLITLRGLRLLQGCDVVVYDDLIDPELLSTVPLQAEQLYVGKRRGRRSTPQEEISQLLVEKAREGKQVVRLKGGDPFVFGRGGEECLALQEAGVPFEVVPGVSSAIAIPALAGIPVTHRGVSQGVHIVTAHTADTRDDLPANLPQLARLGGTLVFLMGLHQLPRLAERLMEEGLPENTPAAVVSGGNAPHPVTVRAPLFRLAQEAQAAGVCPPAVIVVGETAGMDLSNGQPGPLGEVKVGLVGTSAIQNKLRPALEKEGAQVFSACSLRVEELPFRFDLSQLCREESAWVVLTSQNGVRFFFRRLAEQGIDLRRLHRCRFAVIGPATAAALREHGIQAGLCPPVHTSEDLAQALLKVGTPGDTVYLFRSAQSSRILNEVLAENYTLQDIPLYDLILDRKQEPLPPDVQYLAFSSAGGVENFLKIHGSIPANVVCVCIGEVTARALARRYEKSFLISPEISAEGIVAAILKHREDSNTKERWG